MNISNFAAAVNWKRPWTSGSATHVVNARSSANSYHKRWVSHIILNGWSEIVTLCFDFGRQFFYPLISLRIAFTYTYFLNYIDQNSMHSKFSTLLIILLVTVLYAEYSILEFRCSIRYYFSLIVPCFLKFMYVHSYLYADMLRNPFFPSVTQTRYIMFTEEFLLYVYNVFKIIVWRLVVAAPYWNF